MVHLSRVQTGLNDPAAEKHSADPAKDLHHKASQLHLADYNDEFTTSVYGSRFAREDLPKNRMPEGAMPKEVAYQMIKDQLSLDGNPKLKYVGDSPRFGSSALTQTLPAWHLSSRLIW